MGQAKRSMRTPLGRVRAHGASGQGTGHFISQRVSAMALLLLAPWFVISVAVSIHGPTDLATILDFLTTPINAVGVLLLIVVATYHMQIGMQVVIEDYIAKPLTRTVLLLLNTFVPIVLATGAIFAVLLVNFGKA
jgi:succinate dehydrogenase membrane anchor subunit